MILDPIDSKAALSVQIDTVQRTMRRFRIFRLTLCSRDNEAKRISCKACGAPRWDWQLRARLLAILQHRDLEKISLQQVSARPISVHKDSLGEAISRQSALKALQYCVSKVAAMSLRHQISLAKRCACATI